MICESEAINIQHKFKMYIVNILYICVINEIGSIIDLGEYETPSYILGFSTTADNLAMRKERYNWHT